MTACAHRLLLLHALSDGELDAAHRLEAEAHLKECPGCAREWAQMEALRSSLRTPGVRNHAPEHLRRKILGLVDEARVTGPTVSAMSARGRRFSSRLFMGGLITALAAGLVFMLVAPRGITQDVQDQLVSSHVRSLLADHLTDVATSNQHVVKPWFNGRIDFALPVVDLAEQGFPLLGGRLDYIDSSVVPALVYRRNLHTINLFVRPARGPSPVTVRTDRGYVLVSWGEASLEFFAVSDLNREELQTFQREFSARAAR